ncbi:MAG: PEGA domain-containing protein [Methanoculleus sp.]
MPVFILVVALLVAPALAAGTTDVRIVKFAVDGTTILNETTVDYHWLKANLPVQGDGITRYYHQGPVFEGHWEEAHPDEEYDGWNPDEDVLMSMLVKADLGAVMGTDLRDICELVGGAEEGDEIAVRSRDGWQSKRYPYEYIYDPDPRQGPAVLCWYSGNSSGPDAQEAQGQGYPDTGYAVGMRMIFFADTSTNPWGWHIFGNNDMKECWDEDYWNKGGDYWSAAGTSGKWVSEVRVYSQEEPPEPPIADFTANVIEGNVPLTVEFTDCSEGPPTSWFWDFGDDTTSDEQNPTHTYTNPGTYTVTLEVTNVAGTDTAELSITATSGSGSSSDSADTGSSDSDNRTFLFEAPGIAEIVVLAAEIPQDLNLSCEEVLLPDGIPEPPGAVYSYYNITSRNGTVAVDRAVIRFNVPDAWLQENWVVGDDLTLYRYNETWTALETQWIGTENETNTYEAVSPGLSLFAVSGIQIKPATTAPAPTPTPLATTPTGTATPAAVSDTPAPAGKTPEHPFLAALGYTATPPAGGLPGRLLGAVQAFLGLFGLLPAAADPVTEIEPVPTAPTPAPVQAEPEPTPPPIDLTAMRFELSVLSDPPGALIDLDAEYTGRTTPAAFASLPGGTHTVRVRLDGAEPVEREIQLVRDDEVVIEIPVSASVRSASPGLLRGRDQNHYGGVYIDSFPAGAEIFVDGRKVNRKTPAVIYGLREGLHTVRVQEEAAAFSSGGEQIWIERNTVARIVFTGSNEELKRSIAFESEEYAKQPFSVNGRYLGDRFPKTVEVSGITGSYLAVRDGEGYRTYRIPTVAGSGDTVNAIFSAASCNLLVTSTPAGAAIAIDGFQTGFATPYLVDNISEGRHLVSVSRPGYIPEEREILLAASSSDATAKFILEPYTYGSLSVSSTPADARIYLFGRDTGEKTPHTFHYLPIGSYPVKVTGVNRTVTEDVLITPYQIARMEVPEV